MTKVSDIISQSKANIMKNKLGIAAFADDFERFHEFYIDGDDKFLRDYGKHKHIVHRFRRG